MTDILVTVVIAVVFGVIFRLWQGVYEAMGALSKTTGLQLEQISYGMWFIAATVAFLIIRKPGVAFLAETAAASGELLMGSSYGIEALTYGIVQGLAVELIFFLFAYRKHSLWVTCLAGAAAALGSLVMDFYKGYITLLADWSFALLVFNRILGGVIITGVFAYLLVKALEKTGVNNLLRPVTSEDYRGLDD